MNIINNLNIKDNNNNNNNNNTNNNDTNNNDINNNDINNNDDINNINHNDVNNNNNNNNNVLEKKNAKVKKLLSIINSIKLNNEQYIEIYKIIKMDSNIKIMTNKNGVFIDLQYLDKSVLDKLELFIHYITTNELSQNII